MRASHCCGTTLLSGPKASGRAAPASPKPPHSVGPRLRTQHGLGSGLQSRQHLGFAEMGGAIKRVNRDAASPGTARHVLPSSGRSHCAIVVRCESRSRTGGRTSWRGPWCGLPPQLRTGRPTLAVPDNGKERRLAAKVRAAAKARSADQCTTPARQCTPPAVQQERHRPCFGHFAELTANPASPLLSDVPPGLGACALGPQSGRTEQRRVRKTGL